MARFGDENQPVTRSLAVRPIAGSCIAVRRAAHQRPRPIRKLRRAYLSVNWRVLSGNAAEAVLRRIGHSKHADDQRVVVGFGRVDRPVARLEVGNHPVHEDSGRQAERR